VYLYLGLFYYILKTRRLAFSLQINLFVLGNGGAFFHGGLLFRFPFYSDEGLECSLQSGLITKDSSTVGAT